MTMKRITEVIDENDERLQKHRKKCGEENKRKKGSEVGQETRQINNMGSNQMLNGF